MKVTQVADILNNLYAVEAQGDTEAINVASDLSNISDFGTAITNGTTTFSDIFTNTCGNLIDKVGRTMFTNGDFESVAPRIMKNADTWSNMVEMVRIDVGEFIDNKSWEILGSNPVDTNSFNDMFGMELPTVKAKYFNKKITYDNKITETAQQFATAFNSASDMMRFFSAIEERLAQKLAFAEDRLQFLAFDSAMLEVAKTRKSTCVIKAESTSDNLVNQIKSIIRTMAVYNSKYTGDNFVTSTPKSRIKMAIRGDVYDKLITSYANVFNPEFLKIPVDNIDVLPYFQYESAPTVISGITPSSETGKYTSIDGVVFVIYDERLVGCYSDNERVATVPVPNKECTNFFHKKDLQYIVNTDFPCIIATANGSSDVTDETIPTE